LMVTIRCLTIPTKSASAHSLSTTRPSGNVFLMVLASNSNLFTRYFTSISQKIH